MMLPRVVLAASLLAPQAPGLEPLSPQEAKAVLIAEEFVARQGYTKAPASTDPAELQFELLDSHGREMALGVRHDTLAPLAYSAECGTEGGCIVVFEYSDRMKRQFPHEPEHRVGRSVVMDADFKNLRIQHRDIFLRAVPKRAHPKR